MSNSPTDISGAKLEAWRHKLFHIFHFLQHDIFWVIINPLSWIRNAISSEKRCLISMPFLLTYIDLRAVKFSRLLNPEWSIQMSPAPAVWNRSSWGWSPTVPVSNSSWCWFNSQYVLCVVIRHLHKWQLFRHICRAKTFLLHVSAMDQYYQFVSTCTTILVTIVLQYG